MFVTQEYRLDYFKIKLLEGSKG